MRCLGQQELWDTVLSTIILLEDHTETRVTLRCTVEPQLTNMIMSFTHALGLKQALPSLCYLVWVIGSLKEANWRTGRTRETRGARRRGKRALPFSLPLFAFRAVSTVFAHDSSLQFFPFLAPPTRAFLVQKSNFPNVPKMTKTDQSPFGFLTTNIQPFSSLCSSLASISQKSWEPFGSEKLLYLHNVH